MGMLFFYGRTEKMLFSPGVHTQMTHINGVAAEYGRGGTKHGEGLHICEGRGGGQHILLVQGKYFEFFL